MVLEKLRENRAEVAQTDKPDADSHKINLAEYSLSSRM
jgi:hypothetical protein